MKQNLPLKSEIEVAVRFNELDPLGVVWHGNYIKYFEDGREEFGKKYGVSYPDLKELKIMAPVVSVNCNYKKFVTYGETIIVETLFQNNPAAKLILNYTIYRKKDMAIVATGSTIQVFTDSKGELLLIPPPFILEWKRKWGVEN